MEERKIVFYDGDCGFCNRTVQFVLKRDVSERIHYASLDSPFSKSFFNDNDFPMPDMNTFYFYDGSDLFERSTGVLRLLKALGAPWSWMSVFLILPKWLRDPFYNWVAKRRKKLAGHFCVVPRPEQKKLFLDQL